MPASWEQSLSSLRMPDGSPGYRLWAPSSSPTLRLYLLMADVSQVTPRACGTMSRTCQRGTRVLTFRRHVPPPVSRLPRRGVTGCTPGRQMSRMTTERINGPVTTALRTSATLSGQRWACSRVLTHKGGVPCNMHTGALVPRRGTTAGVPGPRRNADECDAGWFAPVATRRRSMLRGPLAPSPWLAMPFWGSPPDPPVALRSGGLWPLRRGSLCPSGGSPPDPPVALRSGGLWPLRRGSLCPSGGPPQTPRSLYAQGAFGPFAVARYALLGGTPPDPPGRSMLRDRDSALTRPRRT